MHAADDDSIPVPHDAFRMPRGVLHWKAPYLFALLALGGGYGVLMLASRGNAPSAEHEPLQLPLLVQIALVLVGLAALVSVLSRAVREVDKRPFVAIAPVFAAFSGLVQAGAHTPMAVLGRHSASVAYAALAIALLGGALVLRDEGRLRRLGWGLVLAPSVLITCVVCSAKGLALSGEERAWLTGLMLGSATLGAAGVVSRQLRNALSLRDGARSAARDQAWSDTLADAATTIAPAPRASGFRADTVRMFAARLQTAWRPTRWQLVISACTIALATYLGVRAVRRTKPAPVTITVPAAAAPAPTPVIEQLSKPGAALFAESTNKLREPSAALRRANHDEHDARLTHPPARVAPASTRIARPAPQSATKPARPTASISSAPVSPAGLPAWGDVASAKPLPTRLKPLGRLPLASTPAASSTTAMKPVAVGPLQSKPAVATPPAKPLSMDQVLDRVESLAKAERKKSGKGAPKTSKRDVELEALISGSMKPKGK